MPKKDKQSKINIQSSGVGNFLPAHFVSLHLPKLLTEVEVIAAKPSLDHVPVEPVVKLKNCDDTPKSSNQLKLPTTKPHRTQGNPVPCPPPIFEIPSPFNVLPATPTIHEPTRFKCFICPDSYYIQGEWDIHEKLVHNLACKSCEETLPTEDDLRDHLKVAHNAKPDSVAPQLKCNGELWK